MKKNLLNYDLQMFADEDVAGENEVEEVAVPEEDETEAEVEETVEEDGNDEPHQQTAEENAQFAAMRRRAEEEARKKYESQISAMDQQIAVMCQGATHPVTGQPITNIHDYMDALSAQQRMAREQVLQDKGIDPAMIDQMIAQNPIVMQAQQVIEQSKANEAQNQILKDVAEIGKYDPNIKTIHDIAAMPNYPDMVAYIQQHNTTLAETYKLFNFDTFMAHQNEAARQQAINQMRGKQHLPSQSQSVSTDEDYVEVPADIMARWKSEGKTEKQIRELYKSVTSKLHIS